MCLISGHVGQGGVVGYDFDSQQAGLGIVSKKKVSKSTRGRGKEAGYDSSIFQVEYVLDFILIPTGHVLVNQRAKFASFH